MTTQASDVWPTVRLTQELTVEGPSAIDGAAPVRAIAPVPGWEVPWPQLLVLLAATLIIVSLVTERRKSKQWLEHQLAEACEQGRTGNRCRRRGRGNYRRHRTDRV